MDILDEIDAALREKRSKWNYTPMREKSETDAIIDQLLREFSSEGSAGRIKSAAPVESYRKREASASKEERIERQEYNRNLVESQKAVEQTPRSFEEIEPAYEEDYYPEEQYDGDENQALDDEYYSDDFEETYDESDGEYEPFSENDGIRNSNGEFVRFMDSEDEGGAEAASGFAVSSIVKTVLKILVLAVFGAFTVIGIINTGSVLYDKYGGNSKAEQQENALRSELERVVYPLIVTETKDFDSAASISGEELVNIGVWEIVINGNISIFKDEESGDYIIPQEQMTYIAEKLFGEGTEFEHVSSGIGDIPVTYDKENKQYIVGENTDLYSLYPKVTDVSENGDSYTVCADCYYSSPSWNSSNAEPAKRVMLEIVKTSEYYNIKSLRTIPVE